jgi:hypothetical protein
VVAFLLQDDRPRPELPPASSTGTEVTLRLHTSIESGAHRVTRARVLCSLAAGLTIALLSAIGIQEARAATDDCRAQPGISYLDRGTERYVFPRDGIVAPYIVEKRVRIVKRATGVDSGNLAPHPAGLARTVIFASASRFDSEVPASQFIRRHGLSRAPPRAG